MFPSTPESPACVFCGAEKPRRTIRIVTWDYEGESLRGSKYLLQTVDALACCKPCQIKLFLRRLFAGALMMLPLALLAPFFGWNNAGGGNLAVVIAALYLVWMMGKGRWTYNWADGLVYGNLMEYELKDWTPLHYDDGKIRFPAGGLHGFLRVVLMIAIPVFIGFMMEEVLV